MLTRRPRAAASAPAQPARSAKGLWFSVHRWLGIGLGLWFSLVGLTGAILVYEDAIDAWLNPHWLSTASRGPAQPVDRLLASAEASGFVHVERLRLPDAEGGTVRLIARTQVRRVGVHRVEAFMDPVSGDVLGFRESERLGLSAPYFTRTVYEFHRNVLLGEPGSNIVGVAGTLLLAGAVSGIVLAWPRGRAAWAKLLAISWRASATRVAYDTHRSAGTLVALLLLLVTVTGITLVWTNYVRDLVSVFSRVQSFPVIPWRPVSSDERAPIDAQLEAARRAFPDRAITEIRMPTGQLSGTQVYLRAPGDEYRLGDTIVWVHPVTAELLVERSDRTRTAGEAFMHWLFPLHSGTAFGSAGMVAMFLTGIAPTLLVLTGLWVWWRKRRGEKIAGARRAERAHGPSVAPVRAHGPSVAPVRAQRETGAQVPPGSG